MLEVTITHEAKVFFDTHEIKTFSISVETIPCGCVRPREVPVIRYGVPEKQETFDKYIHAGYEVYVQKHLKIPTHEIAIKLGHIGQEVQPYPIGIEYFNGMGNYCERSVNKE